jgi:riboflavin kinase
MIDLRFVLFKLARMLGNLKATALLSSLKVGRELGVSQQTASRYLSSLEKNGLIRRVVRKRGQEVSITSEGVSILKEMHLELGFLIEGRKKTVVNGRISIGMGEGAYYVRMYAERIRAELGFQPFYGTLNVHVEEMPASLESYVFKKIPSFEKDGRTFGEIGVIKIKLTSGRKSVDCYLILPERTHHKNELELISGMNLRRKLGLRDGSRVSVEIIQP